MRNLVCSLDLLNPQITVAGTVPVFVDTAGGTAPATFAGSGVSYNATTRTFTFGGGAGGVTSVGLSLPLGVFNAPGPPVTSSGTLTGTLATQLANSVFAGPASGSADVPTFRALVTDDLPASGVTAGTYTCINGAVNAQGVLTSASNGSCSGGGGGGTVTSVGLAMPSGLFTVSGSPVTISGTLTATLASQSANLVLASPNGSSGAPAMRALVAADFPASGATAGSYNCANITVTAKGLLSTAAAGACGVTTTSNVDGSLTISPTSGAVVASLNPSHSNTWAANQLFTGGAGGIYYSNTGSPFVNGVTSQLGQGAVEWLDSSWQPPTATNGRWSSYDTTVLNAVGLTNRSASVADQWNASLFIKYIQGTAQVSGGSSTLANSHLNGEGIYTTIPAGLPDGQNGGTFSGGLPGNPYYMELSGLTSVSDLRSTGYYTEGIASYVCDNAGCGGGTGYKSRMTGFLAAVYKDYAGTDYGTSAFIADSLGTQQTTYAPSSMLRGLGGWLIGLDFSGVTNVPGFVFAELPDGSGGYGVTLANDATDFYVYTGGTLRMTVSNTAVTLSKPLTYSGTLPTGTANTYACFDASGVLISNSSACGVGGGVTSFNSRSGAVTLNGTDVSGAGGFLASGGTVSGATTFSASGTALTVSNTASIGTLVTTNPLATNYGGLGFDGHTASNGAIPIGNGSGFILSTISGTANNLIVTNGSGTITLSASAKQIPGTATNDNASSGNLGEYVSASVAAGSEIAFSGSGNAMNITSISLTAGDWMVCGNVAVDGITSGANLGDIYASISTTSGAFPAAPNGGAYALSYEANAAILAVLPTGCMRQSLSTTTTEYLVANATYSGGSAYGYGAIWARRMR